MKVKVIQPHPYKGIHRDMNAEYEMDEQDVSVMRDYGNIVVVGTAQNIEIDPPPNRYKRRDMRPQR